MFEVYHDEIFESNISVILETLRTPLFTREIEVFTPSKTCLVSVHDKENIAPVQIMPRTLVFTPARGKNVRMMR